MHERKHGFLQRFAEEGPGGEAAPDAGVQEMPSFDALLKQNPQYKAAYDQKVRKAVEGRFRGMREQKKGGRAEEVLRQAKTFAEGRPDFRLEREMANPLFRQLVAEGTPVGAAYALAHQEETLRKAMAFAIHNATVEAVNRVRAGSLRPRESASGARASAPAAPDPKAMTDRERRALRQAVAKGQKVYW